LSNSCQKERLQLIYQLHFTFFTKLILRLNRMKIFRLALLLLLLGAQPSCLLYGQKVQVSNEFKLPSKSPKFKIIGKNNDGIIVRLFGSEDVIEVFSDDLKLLSSKTIEFKNQEGPLQHVMLNKTGAVIFYLMQDKKMSVLFAQPVNSKFMEIGKPIAIDTIVDRKDLVASNLRFKSSADQSFTFIYYPFFAAGEVQSVRFICLDRALQSIYNKNIPIGREEAALESSRSLIDNSGNACLILKSQTRNEYNVFRAAANGDVSAFNISLPKRVFGEPSIESDNKNGNILFSSFYDDAAEPTEEVANGFLFLSVNAENGEVRDKTITPFDKEFITSLTGRETRENGRLYTFNLKKTVLRNDGGGLVIAESFIKEEREVPMVGIQPGFNTYRTSSIYQFNDIIAFSFNAKGVVEWNAVMRKKQASEDDNGAFSSFFIANQKDRLRLIYLDDISSSSDLNEYVLQSNGKSERKTLINQEVSDVMLLPKSGRQVSPDAVVIPSYKSGVLKLIKINY
jgi:hypothetical protein